MGARHADTLTRGELFVAVFAILSATVLVGVGRLDPEAYVAIVAGALGFAAGYANGRKGGSGG